MMRAFKPVGTLPPHPSRVRPCPYGGAPTLTLDTDPDGCQYRPGRQPWTDPSGKWHPYHGLYLDREWSTLATYDTFSVNGYRYARRVFQADYGMFVTIAGTRYRIGDDAVPMVDRDRPTDNAAPRDTGSNYGHNLDTSHDLSARFEALRAAHYGARALPDLDSSPLPPRLYHVVCLGSDGETVYLTGYPDTLENCERIRSKQSKPEACFTTPDDPGCVRPNGQSWGAL